MGNTIAEIGEQKESVRKDEDILVNRIVDCKMILEQLQYRRVARDWRESDR